MVPKAARSLSKIASTSMVTMARFRDPGYHGTFSKKYLVTMTFFRDPGYHGILKGTLKSLVTMALLPGYHGIISRRLHNKVHREKTLTCSRSHTRQWWLAPYNIINANDLITCIITIAKSK